MLARSLVVALLLTFAVIAPAQTAPPTYPNLNAVLWAQRSVEYASVATQTYRAAEAMAMQALRDPHWTAALEQTGQYAELPPAIIIDLDETVWDNSPIQARLTKEGAPYTSEAWQQWVNTEKARAIPGAVKFLNAMVLNGISPFYITNRTCDPSNQSDPTLSNLRKLHIPVGLGRLICKTKESDPGDKSSRRARVAERNRILLIIGDDLNDFVTIPGEQNTAEIRDGLFQAYESLWGEKWFMIPNPTYGSWERSVGMDLNKKLDALRLP